MAFAPRHAPADRSAIAVDLPVRGRPVTVIGSSGRAMAITSSLLDAGAVVTVLSREPTAFLDDLATRRLISMHRRDLAPGDLDSATLIFACTGNDELDASIADAAAARGVFCIVERTAADRTPPVANGRSRAGRVTLVGGGPGDPGLLTVAGRDALARADVIVADRLAPLSVLAELAPHAQMIDASKVPGGRRMEQRDINAHLISHALAGKSVVRFKGGDGFVFGRGSEEVDECVRAGIEVDVIPGVSSAIAAPASAMIPATHRGLTQGFTVVSGHVAPDDPESTVDYAALARANTTIILMMAVANLDAIARALMDGGMSQDTPAAVVADGSLSSQREVRSTLGSLAGAVRAADIGPPATAVIGAVAGFVPGRATTSRATELNALR